MAGDVIVDITPSLLAGKVVAVAYGGRANGVNNPEAAYVADGSGQLFVRETAAGGFAIRLPSLDPLDSAHGVIQDIALDPDNFRIAYIATRNKVFRTVINGGQITATDITGNLSDPSLHSVQVIRSTLTASGRVLVVGGQGGVYRTLTPTSNAPAWTEFGAGLPNAAVADITYGIPDPDGDVLVAGTYGRGAWAIQGVSANLGREAVLKIDGLVNVTNPLIPSNDVVTLSRVAANPLLALAVITSTTGGVPPQALVFQLSTIDRIEVNGLDGNDVLIVDSTNGPISVPGGIRFDGGTGTNTLALLGGTVTQDTYAVGNQSGAGSSTMTFADGKQTVSFLNLATTGEPFSDAVTSPNLTVNGSVGNVVDDIKLDNGLSNSDHRLRVTLRAPVANLTFSPILFVNKAELFINADVPSPLLFPAAGDDDITLTNFETATGLTHVTANGMGGNDFIFVDRTVVPTQVNGGSGNDTIRVGGPVDKFLLSGIQNLLEVNGGSNAIRSPADFDELQFIDEADTSNNNQAPNIGTVTTNTVRGLHMPGGVNYSLIEHLTFSLGSGKDILDGSASTIPMAIFGNGGDDSLAGGSAGDTLEGGLGFDSIMGNGGADTLNSRDGIDKEVVRGGSGNDVADQDPKDDVDLGADEDGLIIRGTDRNDRISIGWQAGPLLVVTINGETQFYDYKNGETIFVYGGDGNDDIVMEESAGTPLAG